MKLSELKLPEPIPAKSRPRHGQRWGRWQLDTSTYVLHALDKYRSYPCYEIDLDRINSPAQLLDWIFQIATKSWISTEDIGDFVRAIEDIFHNVQGKFCPCGQIRYLDAKRFLRANYPEGEELYRHDE